MHARLLVVFAFIFASTASAIVDMKNANYADTWLDITVPGTGFDLRVQRTYNSRSLFSGMFGFGWCSDFETKIDITFEGNLLLTECGGGLQVSYFPESFSSKTVDQSVEQIIALVKKKKKGATPQYLKGLTDQLRDDAEMRAVWAKDVGLESKPNKSGTVYLANGKEVDRISFDGKFYERQLPDGTKQRFDRDGRLSVLYDRNANFIKFNYEKDLLREVVDNNGRKLNFHYFPNKKVKEIIGPNNLKAEYKFNSEDLVVVKNSWKNVYNYDYDSNHNLTSISFPDKTTKTLSYDQQRDWVTSFKDRNGCTEKYQYVMSKNDPQNQYSADATRTCKGKAVNQSKHEFWHKTRADGQKFLFRVKSKTTRDTLDVVYHEVFGKPITVKKGGNTTSFSYFPNGLMKTKASNQTQMEYKYNNPYKKPSTIATKIFDAKGKQLKLITFTYEYDKKGNLVQAKSSDGVNVRLGYDSKGRIASIVDQAKKEVQIKYEARFGKPQVITRPSVGSIRVSYKTNGEISKVESKEGPTVAIQVASTFNSLLDIISPATADLSL